MAKRIRPKARDCPAAASGWRNSWPKPRRQARGESTSRRRRLRRPSNSRPPRTTAATRPPPIRAKVSSRSRLKRHMIRPSASRAAPYTNQLLGGTGSRSRRSTRSGGTRPKAASGGRAKPASATRPVAMPASAGVRPPGGICAGIRPWSNLNRPSWANQPSTAPAKAAKLPRIANCRQNRPSAWRRDSPRQRSKALASKRRVAKRLADKATATPARSTATRLAMFR
ncbi:hypothetical protein D3C81_1101640 [compost metagenome]